MWTQFFIAAVTGIVFIYLPGVLVSRLLGASLLSGAQIAPLFSLPAYCVVAAIASWAGVRCDWLVLFAPVMVVSTLAVTVRAILLRRRRGPHTFWSFNGPQGEKRLLNPIAVACIYVVVGMLATGFIFLSPMGDPGLPPQSFDNCYHLNLPVAFVNSGNWSMFPADLYGDLRSFIEPPTNASFYPAGLHTLAAMLISALGVSSQMAQTAVLAIATALIFPLGMQAFLGAAFSDKPLVSIVGSVAVLVVVAVPWQLIIGWPLPPNALSCSLVPSVGACFIALFFKQLQEWRLAVAFAFIAGLASLTFAQPNGVFTLAGVLAPFLVYQAALGFGSAKLRAILGGRLSLRFASACLCAVAILAIWALCFAAPPLQSVVWYEHGSSFGKLEAVARVLTLNYMSGTPHWIPAFFVFIGMLYTLKERRYLWLTMSYLVSLMIFVAGSAFAVDSFFRYFLSGFWYTDAFRLASYSAITAIPLVALGLTVACEGLGALVRKMRSSLIQEAADMGAALVLAMSFCLATYPFIFDDLRDMCRRFYNDPDLYSQEEQEFVEKAKWLIEPGALVLNDPFDGSALAYSLNGLNVYNRELIGYSSESESQQSKLLRTSLKNIANNKDVRDVVEELGVVYVLILDGDEGTSGTRYFSDKRSEWSGIDEAVEVEPYLTELLHEGDMTLLRINQEAF